MTNKTKFNLSMIVFVLSLSFIYLFTFNKPVTSPQTAQKANTEELKTYEYVITSIDNEGIHGKSTSDNTGIFLTYDTVKGLKLNESDHIKVSFPNDQWDFITKVVKLE
jgi:hypothetical protein